MSENFRDVKTRITQKMDEFNLKQVDICKATGLSKNTVSNYVSGNRIPDALATYKLSKLFQVSMEWLLTGEEPVQREQPPQDWLLVGEEPVIYQSQKPRPLTEQEQNTIWMYQQLDSEKKAVINTTVEAFYNSMFKKGTSSNSPSGGSGEEAAGIETA